MQAPKPMNSLPTVFICATSGDDTGLVIPVLEKAGFAFVLTIRQGKYNAEPFEPLGHVGLIILGDGPKHADDETFAKERSWVRAALDREKAFLGICLGAQLLACEKGGELGKWPTLTDKGLAHLTLTKDGEEDPVLSCVTRGALVYQRHYDTFTVPKEGVNLANSSNRCRRHSDAFRIGRKAYGLQFHPEPTAKMLERGWGLGRGVQAEDRVAVERTGKDVLSAWVMTALCDNSQ